jgi:ion channel-forming bestrophin family protein
LKFLQKIGETDKYKEDGRLSRNRKTVFSPHDWTHFRRSGRVFWNLKTMFRSGIIKGLWLEIGSVTLVALILYLTNLLIRVGALRPLLQPNAMLALPALPFQLTSPALGLLLVFRTNTVNTRWRQARMAWERIESVSCSIARQGMAYLELKDKEEHARRVTALAHACRAQFRPGAAGEEALRANLARLLGPNEAARVMAAPSRPTQALRMRAPDDVT